MGIFYNFTVDIKSYENKFKNQSNKHSTEINCAKAPKKLKNNISGFFILLLFF